MAIITCTAPVGEIRGSIGGVTFSRNKMGTFAKARKKPRVPFSTPRVFSSSLLSFYATTWGYILTAPQRADWNTLADNTVWVNRLGENYSPTGLNLYVRSNTLLGQASRTTQPVAPAAADEAVQDFVLDYDAGTGIRITDFDTLASPPVGSLICWTSGPIPLSVFAWYGPWTFLRTDLIATLGAPETWIADVDCVALRRYFFRFRIIRDDGTASPEFFEYQDTPAVL